ncbi:hypothetical protein AAEX63_14760 [Luteococcus sp. H138]|uniref:hypothetical protein n=1 Tax=unclassified Luteococcus TaxID=2639923 RepID=UPI00313DA5CD
MIGTQPVDLSDPTFDPSFRKDIPAMATFHDHDELVPETPTRRIPTTAQQTDQRSATTGGIIALVCAGFALASAPLLLLIPFVGFAPALVAGAGAFIAARSLRRSSERSVVAVSGLVIATLIFALLAGVATFWNLVVAGPAVGDYQELHDVIEHIRHLIFG